MYILYMHTYVIDYRTFVDCRYHEHFYVFILYKILNNAIKEVS